MQTLWKTRGGECFHQKGCGVLAGRRDVQPYDERKKELRPCGKCRPSAHHGGERGPPITFFLDTEGKGQVREFAMVEQETGQFRVWVRPPPATGWRRTAGRLLQCMAACLVSLAALCSVRLTLPDAWAKRVQDECRAFVLTFGQDRPVRLVFHNAAHDLRLLRSWKIAWPVEDSLVFLRERFPGEPCYRLQVLARRHLHAHDGEPSRDLLLRVVSEPPLREAIGAQTKAFHTALGDAVTLRELYRVQCSTQKGVVS